MKYYEHNQTMPIRIGDVKLMMGDVYIENGGVVEVFRKGVKIYPMPEEKKVEVKKEQIKVEPKVVPKLVKKETTRTTKHKYR